MTAAERLEAAEDSGQTDTEQYDADLREVKQEAGIETD